MKSLSKLVITALLATSIAGCAVGTKFEWDSARAVKEGMSTQEVTALMGKPYMVQSLGDGQQKWIWSSANGWTGSSQVAALTFKDGKVVKALDVPAHFK